jgi:hypothetical protein
VQTEIGNNLEKVRPPHLRSGHIVQDPISPDDDSASALFMSPDEVGRRVLSGMRRRDLYILSHPEFAEGVQARSAALARAVPDEPLNQDRATLLRQFGTLLINPVYSSQKPVTFD